MSSVLLIGDSMIKMINPEHMEVESRKKLPLSKVFSYSYPGITGQKLYDCLLTENLPNSKISLVICHVGTNDASTEREHRTVNEIVHMITKVLNYMKTIYPQARIIFSAIIPRLDGFQERATLINQSVSKVCKEEERLSFFNLSHKFLNENERIACNNNCNKELYRFTAENPDYVHLSEEGVRVLQKSFMSLIKFHFDCPLTNDKHEDTINFEGVRSTFRSNVTAPEVRQFKLTNYQPAINSQAENLQLFLNKDRPSTIKTGYTATMKSCVHQHIPKYRIGQKRKTISGNTSPTNEKYYAYTPVISPSVAISRHLCDKT